MPNATKREDTVTVLLNEELPVLLFMLHGENVEAKFLQKQSAKNKRKAIGHKENVKIIETGSQFHFL